MSETKHTPLPLERRGTMVYGPDNGPGTAQLVAECQTVEQADTIVRACNAHYELVEALREELEALKTWRASLPLEFGNGFAISIDKLERVLAKAKGSSSGQK